MHSTEVVITDHSTLSIDYFRYHHHDSRHHPGHDADAALRGPARPAPSPFRFGLAVHRCVHRGTKFATMDELIEFLAKIALGHATVDCSRHAAAVIDDRGRIVQIGFNKFLCSKNDARCWMKRRPGLQTQHAEINACVGLPKSLLRKCSIVIVRARLGQGEDPYDITCARPCAWCAAWLLSIGIRRIYHTVSKST